MAFRHSTHQAHAPQRIRTSLDESPSQPAAPQTQFVESSQEWILFSPATASVTDRTYTTSTDRTKIRTAGHSRVSDFGSLDTAARSYDQGSQHTDEALEEDEDGELDSLDSHLHEFRTDPSVYRGRAAEASNTVLPTHDGLGSFRIDQTAMGDDVQQRLYAFERFNPRRVKRRRESVELGTELLEADSDRLAEIERTRRIEEWRMEQSRVLFEEIQRETRRRKQSMSSEKRSTVLEREQEDVATLSNVAESVIDDEDSSTANESFWNRITKRVIRDLMGIDDDLLSIIFGESLPKEVELSATPPANSAVDAVNTIIAANRFEQSSWEYRLLERIARELGTLVSHLTDHPGSFTAYLDSQQTPIPYAGLPVIPESARDHVPNAPTNAVQSTTLSPASVEFQPTIQATQPIPISSTSLATPASQDDDSTPRAANPLSQPLTQEEWERDLDINMVFRYLRSRFTRSSPSNTPSTPIPSSTQGTAHLATASTAETAARAARVRQHHPLVNRERQPRVRTYRVSVPGKEQLHIRRGSSGCASERALSKRTSGSSRHYWDHATSVGSGSLLAATGAMGSWGEV